MNQYTSEKLQGIHGTSVKRAFYIGRFQPLHNGHVMVINMLCEQADEIIIGIGSAQKSHTQVDPFTAGERVLMITRTLVASNIHKMWYVIPIEDLQRNALWVSHIRAMTPPFDQVYSSNALVTRLFFEAGVDICSPIMHERDSLSGTEIRRRICTNGSWEDLVPYEVVQVIKEVDGVSRLQDLMLDDVDISERANMHHS
ncbi:MAG: nicotinamide-nucleotide adenylyltransferase [Methanomicrobiales archaeon]|jgi:nicotinamide-nucleotide adenylyltransferase|nr:nicotinamide-nucleotide adenylyltransferase [Methanomicrobiales archaeon]